MYELELKGDTAILKVTRGLTVEKMRELQLALSSAKWEIVQVDRLSLDQSRLIWTLLGELGELIGYTREELRGILENEFCRLKEISYFSISPYKKSCASMEIATEFIQYIIEFAIKEGYNLVITEGHGEHRKFKSIREVVPDIRRYVLSCMFAKTCAVCGSRVEVQLHHSPTVATIGGYEHCDGLKTGFVPLCKKCHANVHNMGDKDFFNLYHIQEVWLSENIVRELKKIYPWYFRAFIDKGE